MQSKPLSNDLEQLKPLPLKELRRKRDSDGLVQILIQTSVQGNLVQIKKEEFCTVQKYLNVTHLIRS